MLRSRLSGISRGVTATRFLAPRTFRRLDRSYWPEAVRQPYTRALLAFGAAPILVVGLFLGLAWSIESVTGGAAQASARALEIAPFVIFFTYGMTLTGATLAFAALWSLRRCGALDYMLAGLAMGAVSGAAPILVSGAPVRALFLVVFAVMGAILMLFVRAIAGIRTP